MCSISSKDDMIDIAGLAMVDGSHPGGALAEAKARDRDWAAEGLLHRWPVEPGDVIAWEFLLERVKAFIVSKFSRDPSQRS